jgi:hypothetical protein
MESDKISYHESVRKEYQSSKTMAWIPYGTGAKRREWLVILTIGVHSAWGSHVNCALMDPTGRVTIGYAASPHLSPLAASATF